TGGAGTLPNGRGPLPRNLLRDGNLGGRVVGGLRRLDRAKGFLLPRHAVTERTGGCSCLFRGGVSRSRDRGPAPGTRAPTRRGGTVVSRAPLRGGSQLSGGIERAIPRTHRGSAPWNNDAVQ